MKKTLASIVLAIFAVAFSTTVLAQDQPVENLEMQLVNADGKVVAKTKTKADGSWNFKSAPAGEYSIVISEQQLASAKHAINTKGTGASGNRTAIKATATFSDGTTRDVTDDKRTAGATDEVGLNISITTEEGVSLVSPRDQASGLASGKKRQHSPMKILKRIDKATPLMITAEQSSVSGVVTYDLKKATK